MTFDEFTKASIQYAQCHREQRIGQALMNALRYVREDLFSVEPDIWEIDNWDDPKVMYWFEAVLRAW